MRLFPVHQVERLRRHFIKTCTKSPFHKDSKEYEELLDSVNAPLQENKKRCYVNPGMSADYFELPP